MNKEYPWNNSIKFPDIYNKDSDNKRYTLYATGDCDISTGRQYISLPSNLKITEEIKRKYNLM